MTGPDRYCPKCGTERTGYLRFCRGCGVDLEATTGPGAAAVEGPADAARISDVAPAVGPPAAPGTPGRGRWGRGRLAAVGIAVILGLGAIGSLDPDPVTDVAVTSPDAPTPPPRVTGDLDPTTAPPRATVAATAAATAAPSFGPTGPTQIGTVTRVVDGDTIRVAIDGSEYPVRYIGMDTPEPDADDAAVRQLADAATAANVALVDGREVILERDVSETDQFDRLLRHVWIDDGGTLVLVNLELVTQGFAQVSTYPPDVKYVELLLRDERLARDAEIGLWAQATTPTPAAPLAPAASPAIAHEDAQPRFIVTDDRDRFDGVAGLYTWSSMAFDASRVTVRWSVTAASDADCRVGWQVKPESGEMINSTVRVRAGENESGNRRYDTPFVGAAFVVSSTCPDWSMSMQGYEPPPSPTDGVAGGGNCDSSYPDLCVPPYPPDLDCGWVYDRGASHIAVRGSDPHGFDGDNDGVGCESP